MTLKLNGTNSVAAPAYAGDDADTGLQCGTNELKLVTGGTARATVDSSGDLGIGTTSPSTLIHGEASTAELRLKSTGASNSALVSFIPGTQTNPFYVYATPTRNLVFQDNSTERMRILSSGGLTFNGDTAAANALDDYEEGIHAITTNSNLTANSSYTNWAYTKIGRKVTISGLLRVSSVSGTDSVLVSLPFDSAAAPSNGSGAYTGQVMHNGVNTENNGLAWYISQSTSQIRFYQLVDNGSWSQLLNSDLAGTDEMYMTCTYFTD